MQATHKLSLSSGLVAALALFGCAADAPDSTPAQDISALSCPTPHFQLIPDDVSWIDPARATFNAGARSGFTWCRVAEASLYTTPSCPVTTFEDIIDYLGATDSMLRGYAFSDGEPMSAEDVAAIEPFTTVCSPGGPGVASAIEANVFGEPVGWTITSEIRCHNCHEFANVYVLWYPDDGRVLVLPYVTGFDS